MSRSCCEVFEASRAFPPRTQICAVVRDSCALLRSGCCPKMLLAILTDVKHKAIFCISETLRGLCLSANLHGNHCRDHRVLRRLVLPGEAHGVTRRSLRRDCGHSETVESDRRRGLLREIRGLDEEESPLHKNIAGTSNSFAVCFASVTSVFLADCRTFCSGGRGFGQTVDVSGACSYFGW